MHWKAIPAALVCFLFLAGQPASGQIAVGISPAVIDRAFEPGQPWGEEIFVRNRTDRPIRFRAYVEDVWYNNRQDVVYVEPVSTPRSAANWVAVVPNEFTAPPGRTVSTRVVITPPREVQGGYYVVVFFEAEVGIQETEQTQLLHTVRLGCVLLLRSVGTESYLVQIPKITATPGRNGQGVDFLVQVSNESNCHVYTDGVVAILTSSNQVVGRTRLERKPVLPGQTRSSEATWAGEIDPGRYLAVVTLLVGEKDVVVTQTLFEVPKPGSP